jgi:hypothetical protein
MAAAPQPEPPAPTPAAVPAAAIVEETAAVSPAGVGNTRTLKEMLNDTPAKPPKDELTVALESPTRRRSSLSWRSTKKPTSRPKSLQVAKKPRPNRKRSRTATWPCWQR